MFERFTHGARQVVVDAQEQARRLGHEEVLAEHLLLALLAHEESISAHVLSEHGVQADRLADDVAALGAGDHDALREFGIDLTAVRERAEAAFGPGALDRPRPRHVGLLRRRVPWAGDHLRFSDSAKDALKESLRQALALRHDHIGVDHLLLGLLAEDQSPAARAVRRLGALPADVRAQVEAQLRRAA